MAEETREKVSLGKRIANFFKNYKSEFKKIAWPSRNDTTKMSVVVIVAIIIASIAIFLLDTGFSTAINALGNLI